MMNRIYFLDLPLLPNSCFKWREVFQRDGEVRIPSTFRVFDNAVELARRLQPCQDRFSVPFIVTSWYRTAEANRRAGGSSDSLHLSGAAVDFYPAYPASKASMFQELVKYLDETWEGGLGVYPQHIHCDIGSRRRWGLCPSTEKEICLTPVREWSNSFA